MDAGMIGVAIGAATALSSVVLYVVRSENAKDVSRLDGRMNAHEAACSERQKKLDERHEQQTNHLASIDAKLDRLLEMR